MSTSSTVYIWGYQPYTGPISGRGGQWCPASILVVLLGCAMERAKSAGHCTDYLTNQTYRGSCMHTDTTGMQVLRNSRHGRVRMQRGRQAKPLQRSKHPGMHRSYRWCCCVLPSLCGEPSVGSQCRDWVSKVRLRGFKGRLSRNSGNNIEVAWPFTAFVTLNLPNGLAVAGDCAGQFAPMRMLLLPSFTSLLANVTSLQAAATHAGATTESDCGFGIPWLPDSGSRNCT